MIVTLHTQALQTLALVRAFVEGSESVAFTLTDRTAAYGWMGDTLKQFGYRALPRPDKGVLRKYLAKVTGLSRAQVARGIAQFAASRAHRGSPPRARRPLCTAPYNRGHPPAG